MIYYVFYFIHCLIYVQLFYVVFLLFFRVFWALADAHTCESKVACKFSFFFTKKMRIASLIIFRVEWNSYVSYLRGKQPKYFLKNNIFFTTEPKDRCVVIMGFQKTRSLRSNLLRRGQRQSTIIDNNRK